MAFCNQVKSIAIGSFDGMHVAHQKLVEKVDAVVVIERNGGYLTSGYRRTMFTSKMCCFYHFDVIKRLSPEAFMEKLNTDFPQLEKIVVGYDFHFGKDKAGTAETLKELFKGIVEIVEEVSVEGIPVHSRTIKAYLKEGNVEMANKLLGRKYVIEGQVIKGQGLGKKELVPTLNLEVKEYQLPFEGVYATQTLVDGAWLDSVSFLGHRVTTDDSYAVETHILETDIGEVQGKIAVKFISFIRENLKFESLNSLKAQINEDISQAKMSLA